MIFSRSSRIGIFFSLIPNSTRRLVCFANYHRVPLARLLRVVQIFNRWVSHRFSDLYWLHMVTVVAGTFSFVFLLCVKRDKCKRYTFWTYEHTTCVWVRSVIMRCSSALVQHHYRRRLDYDISISVHDSPGSEMLEEDIPCYNHCYHILFSFLLFFEFDNIRLIYH